LSIGYDTIAVGNKTLELRPGDPYCFNDCSREFYTELGKLATFASQGSNIDFIMPLIGPNGPLTKREVVEYVSAHGFDVRKLWSCYADRVRPCGECYHCAEIKAAGVWDMVS
jgi:7-cyano-7-deazaguanine synthase in queuosine biosynthesis